MKLTDDLVVARSPLNGAVEAYSGARLERVETADGRHLVLKHLAVDGDWLTRAVGSQYHLRQLWASGVLDRLSTVVDHAIVDVIDGDGHDVVVMRDVSEQLVPPHGPVSRAASRELLTGLATLHHAGANKPNQALCPIEARYRMFAPEVHAADDRPGAHPSREFIVAGWNQFAEHVEADVVDAIFAVHRHPALLGQRLAKFPPTLVHGDAKFPNLGLGRSGLVAVDWGDLTGYGPAEIDVAWYALMNSQRIGATPDEIFADYDAVAGGPLEPEAVDLACVGSLAQMGFKFAGYAIQGETPQVRAEANASLGWWSSRVRAALERTGIV